MDIIKQIEALPNDVCVSYTRYYAQHDYEVHSLPTDDLKALANSHTRLLEAAKDMIAVLATPLDHNQTSAAAYLAADESRRRLFNAIEEAEQLDK